MCILVVIITILNDVMNWGHCVVVVSLTAGQLAALHDVAADAGDAVATRRHNEAKASGTVLLKNFHLTNVQDGVFTRVIVEMLSESQGSQRRAVGPLVWSSGEAFLHGRHVFCKHVTFYRVLCALL